MVPRAGRPGSRVWLAAALLGLLLAPGGEVVVRGDGLSGLAPSRSRALPPGYVLLRHSDRPTILPGASAPALTWSAAASATGSPTSPGLEVFVVMEVYGVGITPFGQKNREILLGQLVLLLNISPDSCVIMSVEEYLPYSGPSAESLAGLQARRSRPPGPPPGGQAGGGGGLPSPSPGLGPSARALSLTGRRRRRVHRRSLLQAPAPDLGVPTSGAAPEPAAPPDPFISVQPPTEPIVRVVIRFPVASVAAASGLEERLVVVAVDNGPLEEGLNGQGLNVSGVHISHVDALQADSLEPAPLPDLQSLTQRVLAAGAPGPAAPFPLAPTPAPGIARVRPAATTGSSTAGGQEEGPRPGRPGTDHDLSPVGQGLLAAFAAALLAALAGLYVWHRRRSRARKAAAAGARGAAPPPPGVPKPPVGLGELRSTAVEADASSSQTTSLAGPDPRNWFTWTAGASAARAALPQQRPPARPHSPGERAGRGLAGHDRPPGEPQQQEFANPLRDPWGNPLWRSEEAVPSPRPGSGPGSTEAEQGGELLWEGGGRQPRSAPQGGQQGGDLQREGEGRPQGGREPGERGPAEGVEIAAGDLAFTRVVGEGSFGRVYLGKWRETTVAIKRLHPAALAGGRGAADWGPGADGEGGPVGDAEHQLRLARRGGVVAALRREAALMAGLRHPHVVMFLGLCPEPPCLVTEYMPRGSLRDILSRAREAPVVAAELGWGRRLGLALGAAKGLLYLHRQRPPVLHRDLTSANLLVDKHWRCKLARGPSLCHRLLQHLLRRLTTC